MARLNAEEVVETLTYCLFRDEEITNGEVPTGTVKVEGIVSNYGFHPGRLAEKKEKIIEMLSELPEGFNIDSKGKGWSFLQACNDKHDNQWGQHQDMEALFVLGMAVNRVKCILPKDLWAVLPGGMPYFAIYNTDI